MISTKAIWKDLVKKAAALKVFKDVRALPFNRINDLAFLESFPGLKLPACLVVFLGHRTEALGQGASQVARWTFVMVFKDADGTAWEEAVDAVDKAEDKLLDQYILGNQVVIHRSCSVGLAATAPEYAVYELSAETRQVEERDS